MGGEGSQPEKQFSECERGDAVPKTQGEQSDNDLSSAIEPPIRRGAAGEELNCEVQQKQSRADDIPTITIQLDQKQILLLLSVLFHDALIYIKL
ncbi:hypothetical protein G5I_07738 [Acromyrmex echinatior]|uniref:Uncharacterized protein n=1 Tax=Acromyrmex echinatior TaxID=103372 RepID=F4WPL9_ACREC|nr:hypothetical protein G5I_07738 [Acromyrmex echinatior]